MKNIQKLLIFLLVNNFTINNNLANNLTDKLNSQAKRNGKQLYLSNFDSIEGWYEKPFLPILDAIDRYQTEFNIKGNLAEIGVYHGKSLMSLYFLAKEKESVLAVDCFDYQEYNYDLSGMGCQFKSFAKNVQEYCGERLIRGESSKLKILVGDSSKMLAKDFMAKCNNEKFRLFSIDGCHTGPMTLYDLTNAYESLELGGVIIIDDYFNKDWPGVSAGVSEFMLKNPGKLVPFFIGFNKILLTHPEYAPHYIWRLKKHFTPKKDSQLFNADVLIFE